ncbi:conjugative transfer signal peptidase TraF [Roseixanthobacter glucoisosaccharinicivorans]|uniref:conjugative transfer signal peptidase TraF n=1 Tax=Roseixanthobacter glucoisosaccharinicivorans TaxID=3119923 RepID=UPI00372C67E8
MTRRRNLISILTAGAAIATGIVIAGWWAGLRINMTRSFPLGLWRIEALDRPAAVGDRIFICPPVTVKFEQALERGYIRRGSCPGGLSPLIKTVAAIAGQQIDVADRVSIGGHPLPDSDVRHTDAAGHPLTPFAGGIVPAGELYLHSNYAGSYDSRYFGPVPSTGLLGLARPVFTFDP